MFVNCLSCKKNTTPQEMASTLHKLTFCHSETVTKLFSSKLHNNHYSFLQLSIYPYTVDFVYIG